MRAAVLAFVDYKFSAGRGTLRDGALASGWRDGLTVQQGIPDYSDEAIEATIAYCEYVYRRYGRFPAYTGPFRTVMAYQAHRLDPAFYERFYDLSTVGLSPNASALSKSPSEQQSGWVAPGERYMRWLKDIKE